MPLLQPSRSSIAKEIIGSWMIPAPHGLSPGGVILAGLREVTPASSPTIPTVSPRCRAGDPELDTEGDWRLLQGEGEGSIPVYTSRQCRLSV